MSSSEQAPGTADPVLSEETRLIEVSNSMPPGEEMVGSTRVEAPTKFHVFPKLSVELQLMIWEAAANAEVKPRLLDVYSGDQKKEDGKTGTYFFTTHKVPTILQVNKDSRRVGLSIYTLEFGTEDFPACIPVNWNVDNIALLYSEYSVRKLDTILLKLTSHGLSSVCIGVSTTIRNDQSHCNPYEAMDAKDECFDQESDDEESDDDESDDDESDDDENEDEENEDEESDDEEDSERDITWGHGTEQLYDVMSKFPFADGVKEVTLFSNSYFNRPNRLKLMRKNGFPNDTKVEMCWFSIDEFNAEGLTEQDVVNYIQNSVLSNQGWEFHPYHHNHPDASNLDFFHWEARKFGVVAGVKVLERTISLKLRDINFLDESIKDVQRWCF